MASSRRRGRQRDESSFLLLMACWANLGVSNGPLQFESARKIWPLLELLAKLDECSLAEFLKVLDRMLGFSETLRKHVCAMNVS